MYHLVFYLIVLLLVACVFGFLGILSYSPLAILFSAIVATAVLLDWPTKPSHTFSKTHRASIRRRSSRR